MDVKNELRKAEDAVSAARAVMPPEPLAPNPGVITPLLFRALEAYGNVIAALVTHVAELEKRTGP